MGYSELSLMAPPKKSKKSKKDGKLKKCKSGSVVPVEPAAPDSEWWDSFWHKNSSIPGFFFFLFTELDLQLLCYTALHLQHFILLIVLGKLLFFNSVLVKLQK